MDKLPQADSKANAWPEPEAKSTHMSEMTGPDTLKANHNNYKFKNNQKIS